MGWQRAWWAYALYGVVLAAAVSGIVAWRLRDSRRRVRALAREIEKRRRMTARIERANRDLERGERERTRFIAALEARNREMEGFVYTVSHDLKSPLVTISGFLGFLEKDLADGDADRVRQDIERIRTAVVRLHDNLKGLLELSRLGLSVGKPEEFELGPLATEAVEAHAVQIGRRQTRVEIAADLPWVFGDRARLLGVLRNLIDNAIKFGPTHGGRIGITASRSDGETTVAVADGGIGIDPKHHDKIFGIFDRLDPRAEGTGIGLAHSRRTVEAHGGRIWVESEGLGHGSTFRFTLPTRAASPLNAEEPAPPSR